MLAETGVETVVDTDVGIGAKALVGWGVSSFVTAAAGSSVAAIAGAGALLATPVCAAVAVAAGTVLLTWAANGVCKWVTGTFFGEQKNIKDAAADIVVGTGKAIGKAVSSARKAIGNAVSSAGKLWQNGGMAYFQSQRMPVAADRGKALF